MKPTETDLSTLSTITAAIVLYPKDYKDFIGCARTICGSEFMLSALDELEQELKKSLDLYAVLLNLGAIGSITGKFSARALSWNLLKKDNLL